MYDKENIFAKIIKKELDADIISESENTITIKDKYPDAPMHNLVMPKGEYTDLREFLNSASDVEKLDFLNSINHEINKIKGGAKVLINIEKDGGQCVFHLHAHVLGGFSKNVD